MRALNQRFGAGVFGASIAMLAALGPVSCGGAQRAGGAQTVVAAPSYRSAAAVPFEPPAAEGALWAAAIEGAQRAGRTVRADEGLALFARDVATRVGADAQHRAPSVRALQALAWARGVIDPVPAIAVVYTSAPAVNASDVRAQAESLVRGGEFTVLGFGAVPARGGGTAAVLAVAVRRVTLTRDISRRASSGSRLVLAGRVADGYRNPEVAITNPEGSVETIPMGEGPEFLMQLPVPRRGAWQIEVLGEGTSGGTVLANFPVYVDMDPPAATDEVSAPRTETPEQAEGELFRLANEARQAAGLRPLQAMPQLAVVARAHSSDMAQNHFVAHVSPTTGAPAERVRRAGLQSGLVLENIGRGYSAREMHDGLLASPGHRANLLNERATHLGVGVAAEQDANGGLLVTENFIEVAAAIDLSAAPARLLELVNSARGRRGVPALEARGPLAEVATNTAQEYFRSPRATQQEVVDRANRQLSRNGLLYRRVSVLATRVTRLEEAGMLEPLMEPDIRAVGIGVAQGTRPGDPPNSLFVVYVVGYPR